MKKNSNIISILQLLLIFSIVSCTEPYALQSSTYESALVVEAVLTNEAKQHEVKLTRTFRLDENENENENETKSHIKINITAVVSEKKATSDPDKTKERKSNTSNIITNTVVPCG